MAVHVEKKILCRFGPLFGAQKGFVWLCRVYAGICVCLNSGVSQVWRPLSVVGHSYRALIIDLM